MLSNAQIWADLFNDQVEARRSGDTNEVARAEKKAADFLAAEMGKANKHITPGMSLQEIMKANAAQLAQKTKTNTAQVGQPMRANGTQVAQKKYDRRQVAALMLAEAVILAVGFFAYLKWGRRRA
jgi:hypothetical protein